MQAEIRPLHLKLAQVASAIGRIEKRGYNDFHKYNYALEADIVEGVRQELASRSVTLLPSVESVQRDGDLTTVMMTFTFTDGDSGDTATMRWAGTGSDKGDKAIWKAYTGALKYVLMKTFLIATGDDPEGDTKVDKRIARREKRAAELDDSRRRQDEPEQDYRTRIATAARTRFFGLVTKKVRDDKSGKFAAVLLSGGDEGKLARRALLSDLLKSDIDDAKLATFEASDWNDATDALLKVV